MAKRKDSKQERKDMRAAEDVVDLSDLQFTPAQQRIVDLMADGLPHTKEELRRTLWDDLASTVTAQVHLCHIRKKLRTAGCDVLIQYLGNRLHYRLVAYLAPQNLADLRG
ncbi:MAG TPA: helix-turn-helix domain-containing protein [Aquabacterium sp.]|nr:helix-turn-helix domain-containing protein [Aquabacterium sp.]